MKDPQEHLRCPSCGILRNPTPAEKWRDTALANGEQYLKEELARYGLPDGFLTLRVSAFNHLPNNDGSYDIGFGIQSSVVAADRFGFIFDFAYADVERVVAAAIIFVKAWQGRSTPEGA